jgi:oxalate---CoA ligase
MARPTQVSFFSKLGSLVDLQFTRTLDPTEILSEVRRKSAALKKLGLKKNQRVILVHGNSADFFTDLFALWNIGCVPISLHPSTTASELHNVFRYTDTQLMIGNAYQFQSQVNPYVDTKTLRQGQEEIQIGAFDSQQEALYLMTSGSTSNAPKCVVHTFKSISDKFRVLSKELTKTEIQNTLCLLPTSFGHGLICNSLFPLFFGARLVITRPFDIVLMTQLGNLLKKEKITFFSSVPSIWQLLTKSENIFFENEHVKVIHCASAPMDENIWKTIEKFFPKCRIRNVYGLTELAGWVAATPKKSKKFHANFIGSMLDGKCKIIDTRGRSLKSFQQGEILLQTKGLMAGYYRKKRIKADSWFATGDVGYLDKKKGLYLLGRLKTMVNYGGLKIYPEELDALLLECPMVKDVCCFAIPNEIFGEMLGAAIVLGEGATVHDVKKWCAGEIAKYKVPHRWYIVSSIQRDSRGKINRSALAQKCTTDENLAQEKL